MHTSNPSFPIVFFSQYYSRHPARYIPSFRRGLGRLLLLSFFVSEGIGEAHFLNYLYNLLLLFFGFFCQSFFSTLCNPYIFNELQRVLWKGMFCIAKGRLLHLKRASFTVQKVLFYTPKEHLLKTNHEKSCQQQPLPTVWNILKNIPTPYPHLLITVHNTNLPPPSYGSKCVLLFIKLITMPQHLGVMVFFLK